MRDAFIVTPSMLTIVSIGAVAKAAGYSLAENGRAIWIGDGDEYVDIAEDRDVEQYVDEAEGTVIRTCGANPRYYHLRFRDSLRAAHFVITLFGEREDVILDNDHGLLVPLKDFAAAVAAAPGWDWSVAEQLPGVGPSTIG